MNFEEMKWLRIKFARPIRTVKLRNKRRMS